MISAEERRAKPRPHGSVPSPCAPVKDTCAGRRALRAHGTQHMGVILSNGNQDPVGSRVTFTSALKSLNWGPCS